ncbi:ABC transporter substrate-binding protein [Bosea sp. F3-2]|uniref:ABC transporter substrate-binding protein n=1 Tax=Bosea sp. F3-2 TaxID=2599640 RepID=UPI0016563A05|nr:ABC transporter substrate-binding protein [Bosea sp. F3-2]
MSNHRSRRHVLAAMAASTAAVHGLAIPGIALAQDSKRLRIAVGFGLPSLPVRIAQQNGYFAEQARKLGLSDFKVDIVQLSGQNPIIDSLLSGQIDMCISGQAGMLIAWDRTRGTSREICGFSGISNNRCMLMTVDPRIRSLADFGPNDKIAMPSTANTQAFILKMACEKQFGDSTRLDKSMISLPHPDALNGLLRGGIVAAHFASPPYVQIIAKDPRARTILTSGDVFGGLSSFVIVAGTRSFAEANPDIVKVFLAALQDAITFIENNPAQSTEIYLQIEPTTILSKAEFQRIIEDPQEGYSLNTNGIMTYAGFMKKTGFLRNELKSIDDFMIPAVHALRNT